MNYFHHYSIRRYTAAILDSFNDIHIKRFKPDGTVDNDYIVPIKFGSAQKAFMLSEDDFMKYREAKYNVLPRISLSFDGMTKANNRETNKLNQVMFLDNNSNLKYTYNSVSYNLEYSLNILTDTFTDLTIILEQIIPLFNPTYNLKIKDMDFHDEYRIAPLRLTGISTELDVDLTMDDDIRLCSGIISFSIDANLFPPIKDSKIIYHIRTNFYDGYEEIPKGNL